MNFCRYKRIYDFEVIRQIEKRMELTAYQKEKIRDVINDLPFQFIAFDPPDKANFFIRLTAPFYLLYWVLLVITMPLKWLFTGTTYYQHDGKVLSLLRNWYKRLGF